MAIFAPVVRSKLTSEVVNDASLIVAYPGPLLGDREVDEIAAEVLLAREKTDRPSGRQIHDLDSGIQNAVLPRFRHVQDLPLGVPDDRRGRVQSLQDDSLHTRHGPVHVDERVGPRIHNREIGRRDGLVGHPAEVDSLDGDIEERSLVQEPVHVGIAITIGEGGEGDLAAPAPVPWVDHEKRGGAVPAHVGAVGGREGDVMRIRARADAELANRAKSVTGIEDLDVVASHSIDDVDPSVVDPRHRVGVDGGYVETRGERRVGIDERDGTGLEIARQNEKPSARRRRRRPVVPGNFAAAAG